jgi:hypothetical protein
MNSLGAARWARAERCSEGIRVMQTKSFEAGLVRYIVEGAAFESARSNALLRAIENVNQRNAFIAESFERIAHGVSEAAVAICKETVSEADEPIDADGSVADSIDRTMGKLFTLWEIMKRAHRSAVEDKDLRDEDGVVESFARVIAAVSDAHNALNELKWAIMERDGNLSPRSGKGPFKTVDDLFASLGV